MYSCIIYTCTITLKSALNNDQQSTFAGAISPNSSNFGTIKVSHLPVEKETPLVGWKQLPLAAMTHILQIAMIPTT